MAKRKGGGAPEEFGFTMLGSEDAQKTFAINDWISTGSYNLNRIISGSLFKGIAEKRITALIGEEAVGKTLFALCAAREAQKKGYKVAFFDSENALSPQFASAAGIEIGSLLYKQIITIEEFRRDAMNLIEWKSSEYGMDQPLLIILDSFGGLTAQKFLSDVEAGKDTMDMGIFAKVAKATMKMVGSLLAKHNVTFIYTNHIYVDNSGYVPIPVQTGGSAGKYYPSTVVMLKKRVVKDADKEVTGINIKAQTTKSRIVPPYQVADVYLDWLNGLDPFSGLFDLMVDCGFIKSSGGWFEYDGGKFRRSDLEKTIKNDQAIK